MIEQSFKSQRMKSSNPMFNEEYKKKRLNTIREKGNWGNFNIGKKKPKLTKSNLENNPMKNPVIKEKAILNSTKTKKRLYAEGKLKVWNDGMSKEEYLKHMPNDFVDKIVKATHNEKTINKISNTHLEKWKDKGYRENRLKYVLRGEKHPRYGVHLSKEQIEKYRKTIRMNGGNKSISEKMKEGGAMRAMAGNKRQSKPEMILFDLIKKNNLPFNYVGKGGITFKGDNHSFNPDFLSKNPKHVIEVFGNYWHNLPERKKLDKERLATYTKYGYKTLIIWENEVIGKNKLSETDIISKINNFIGGN